MRDVLNKYLPYLAEALLLAALGYGVYGWFDGGRQAALHADGSMPMVEKPTHPSAEEIAAVPLFGEQAKVSVAPPPKPAPVRPLSIRVLGTVAAGKDSWVVISDMQGGHQRSVHVGEYIEPGARLKQVDADAIVVQRNGRNELVAMEQWQKLNVTITETDTLQPHAPAGKAAKGAKVAAARKQPRPAVKRIVRQPLPALSLLMTDAEIVPHRVKGRMDGFVIRNIIFGSAFQKGGLFNGDVITALNGAPLTRAEQKNELLRALQKKNTKLAVRRAGKVVHIVWDF